jgi:hypothetical protein
VTKFAHDFDHVVSIPDPGEPEWVREPDDDYNADDDPGYDDLLERDGVPMAIVIGGCVAVWDDDVEGFVPLEGVQFVDGKVVAR